MEEFGLDFSRSLLETRGAVVIKHLSGNGQFLDPRIDVVE
jgi:hypothetical protein